jgi:hypothetical protein
MDMESGVRQRNLRILEWITIAAFCGALAYPGIDPWIRPNAERTAIVEFRNPAKLPAHPRTLEQWLAFPGGYEAWFNDHFGLRDKLVRWHNLLAWYAFGVSPTPKLVLGQDAWIYYADDKSLDVYRGAYPLSEHELDGWRRALTARRDWLAAQGIRYLFVFVPNKDQVYPEHLPAAFRAAGEARVDQVTAYMRAHSDVDVLDLRPSILAEKKNDRPGDYVYHRLGTHWTDRGAYAAYLAIVERMKTYFPKLVPIPRNAFAITAGGPGDTWAPHLYMEDLLTQTSLEWKLRTPGRAEYDAAELPSMNTFVSKNPDASLPSAYILHDSFGPTLRPWLAENFSRATWTWGWSFESSRASIVEQHPDIVIELFVDRVLVQNYPQVTGAEGPGPRRDAFNASSEVLLRLDAASLAERLKPYGKAELVNDDAAPEPGLTVRCPTVLDGVLIPALDFPADEDVIVAIDMDAPDIGGLDLFFQKEDEKSFERRRVCSEKLYKGGNKVYIQLFAGGLCGPMFLHLRNPGSYRIHSIEVRAVRD